MPKVRKSRKPQRQNGPYAMVDESMEENAPVVEAPKVDAVAKVQDMVEEIASKKLTKKQMAKLEAAREKEAEEARLMEEEAKLPPVEQTKRQIRRKQVQEAKEMKRQVNALKVKRSRLGKKSIQDRDTRKKLNKQIRELMATLKAKHTAEWKMIGVEEEAVKATEEIAMADTDAGED
eukprot:Blabericola_migrator_1__11268@NODE_663_length_6971_cov_273_239426_g484_i0_p4_GENE_NODE_663_length_6971_cov_273_239426_g484_i0NODE_663_length_6971_cov_273_239426_g484_i0_p4_ORF_typecomplete_len177_score49_84DUF2309/PF10070_9/0_084HUCCDC81_bac_2/PF18175_1/3_5e02HUCCDC81_bac_2/PF18175_1/0_93SAVED/PF18145_1/0_2EURL/PF06937_11/0_57AAA_13/PF13166_6/1_8DUF4771/PF15995_5/1DUF4771/PF15995_5/3_5e02Nop53/PF07767_11/5_2MRPS31/PF15433_6/6_4betaPIX_CC/PF16523_5/1_4e02betaPIX_CC/PF16523_5/4_2EPOP/PF15223_6/8_4